MPDTELTVSLPIVAAVLVEGLDFNRVFAAIRQAAAQACSELLGRLLDLRPSARRGVEEVRTACELAATQPSRAACHWWQRPAGRLVTRTPPGAAAPAVL